jgi:EAL domain-containing protein (putative c-di-GMP-specific phosphodiesterase class I)
LATDKNIFYFPPSCFIKAEAFLGDLLATIRKTNTDTDARQKVINVLAKTAGCEIIFWLKGAEVDKSSKELKGRFRLYVEKWLQENRPDENYNNTVNLVDIQLEESDHAVKCLWIDLSDSLASTDAPIDSLLFYNIKKEGWLDEGSGVMAKAFAVSLTENAAENDLTRLKFKIIDRFRGVYSYVSASMYEQRFDYFKKELQGTELYFEPIIKFSPSISHFNIWGVEALARKNGKAPVELFKAAENWGIRFQTELDIYILEKALSTYRQKCNEGNFGSYSQLITITINVYPNTLLREAYRKHLLDLIKKYRIQGDKVIIEISEKEIIYSGDSEDGTLVLLWMILGPVIALFQGR